MPTATWDLVGNAGNAPSSFLGTTDTQPLILKTANAERLRLDSNGNVGIGTQSPGAILEVSSTKSEIAVMGSSQSGIAIRAAAQKDTAVFATSDSGVGVDARSNSAVAIAASSQQSIAVRAAAQKDTGLFATSDAGMGVDSRSNSNIGVQALSQTNTGLFASSNTGVGVDARSNSSLALSASSQEGIAVRAIAQKDTGVFSTSDAGMGVDARSNSNVAIQAASLTNTGLFATSNSGRGVDARSTSGVGVYATGGQFAGYFEGNIVVTGDVLLTGADCAEHFDAVEGNVLPDAGAVVVIDGNGQLRECQEAYDHRVAGVVSGAGEYRPAIVLDRRPSESHRIPVALVGKVYCKVDAQYGAIRIGDLLTSSPTPGHAMKAAEPTRSFGTILGKALRAISTGTDLIPILVALQ